MIRYTKEEDILSNHCNVLSNCLVRQMQRKNAYQHLDRGTESCSEVDDRSCIGGGGGCRYRMGLFVYTCNLSLVRREQVLRLEHEAAHELERRDASQEQMQQSVSELNAERVRHSFFLSSVAG